MSWSIWCIWDFFSSFFSSSLLSIKWCSATFSAVNPIRYLDRFRKTETHGKFLQYSREVEVNWEAIKTKIQLEKDDEKARGGVMSGSGGK